MKTKIAIASDDVGFERKEEIKNISWKRKAHRLCMILLNAKRTV